MRDLGWKSDNGTSLSLSILIFLLRCSIVIHLSRCPCFRASLNSVHSYKPQGIIGILPLRSYDEQEIILMCGRQSIGTEFERKAINIYQEDMVGRDGKGESETSPLSQPCHSMDILS